MAAHDVAPLEPFQLLVRRGVRSAQPRHGTRPEHAARDRRLLSCALLRRRQAVQPRADQRLQARRHRQGARLLVPAEQAAVSEHAHGLLEEERVAAGGPEERRGVDLRYLLDAEELVQQGLARSLVEHRELDRRAALAGPDQRRRALGQLVAPRADDEDRCCHVLGREVLDQLDERRLGPVEVLECPPDPPVQLGLRDLSGGIGATRGRRDADEVRERCGDRPQLVEVVDGQPFDPGAQLRRDALLRVALEDAGRLLDDLCDGPVGDALPVGQAAAPADRGLALGGRGELGHQAALADAGVADEGGDERPALVDGAPPRREQDVELGRAADERRVARAAHRVLDPHGFVDRYGLLLALGDDRLALDVLDRVPARQVGALADEDAVHRRRSLDARGGVEDVPPRDALALLDARAERHDRLAGGDADADLELPARVLLVQRRDRLQDGEAGPHRALRVVLVCDGHAEVRDDGVADVLLHRSAEADQLGAEPPVVRLEQRQDVLGVELLRPARRADHVDEEQRVELPLLLDRRGSGQRRAAREAELRDVGVLGRALRADGHYPSLGQYLCDLQHVFTGFVRTGRRRRASARARRSRGSRRSRRSRARAPRPC